MLSLSQNDSRRHLVMVYSSPRGFGLVVDGVVLGKLDTHLTSAVVMIAYSGPVVGERPLIVLATRVLITFAKVHQAR